MSRFIWCTDIHLDFLDSSGIQIFLEKINGENGDALLISGDISHSRRLKSDLITLAEGFARPIYFVLGNHDYWGARFEDVQNEMKLLCTENHNLNWLGNNKLISLNNETALIGHDGINDGRYGDFASSTIALKDYRLINNFSNLDKKSLLKLLNSLGDLFADYFDRMLHQAFEGHNRVYLLTHVPPFREAIHWNGVPADKNWLPHFSCMAVARRLKEIMNLNRDKELTLLTGHTHQYGRHQIFPNLNVWVAPAEYNHPEVHHTFTF